MLLAGLNPLRFKQSLAILLQQGPLNEYCDQRLIPQMAVGINSILSCYRVIYLMFFLRKHKPDILISYLFHSNIVARIFGKLLGIKVVICGQRNIDLWRKKWHVWLDRYTSKWCDKIISNTEVARLRLIEVERIPSSKIIVIPNGVSIAEKHADCDTESLFRKMGLNKESKFVLCAASFQKKKGHACLIRAFKEVLKYHPDLRLVLAGEGKERGRLELLVNELGLQDWIMMPGVITPIESLMRLSECVVLPSIWEGMPNVLLEAMALKVPVVATETGGVPEIISNDFNGILVPVHDEPSLAGAIVRVLNDADLKYRLVVNAYNTITEKYSHTSVIKKFEHALIQEYENKQNIVGD